MFTRAFVVVSLFAVTAGLGQPAAGSRFDGNPSEQEVTHALSRLTFGPKPGDVERVKEMGLQRWIDAQLSPSRIEDDGLNARLKRLETLTLDAETIQREYAGPAMVERRQRQLRNPAGTSEDPAAMREMAERPRGPVNEALRKDRQVMADLQEAKLLRVVYSERQLEEVLVDFWFNHFNVFAGKGATRNYVSQLEREAIRPHVLGNFRDMLEATAKSPAMLFYLDNWQNVAPQSPGASATRRRGAAPTRTRAAGPSPTSAGAKPGARPRPTRGINENYARELLELHTLGVDGGYTQEDIVNVARAFTGWTLKPRDGSGAMFIPALHDRGGKTVLGHAIKAGGGEQDAARVLDILAAHPSTARHIASKLAIRFVSDDPPRALVDRAAARFTATKGNLREVVRAIVTSPEFSSPDAYRAKVKTPLEFVASAMRATGADIGSALPLARELRDMGMPLYLCQPPTGYDDTASSWVSAGALVSRMNFAVALGKNTVQGVRVPLSEKETVALQIGAPEFQRR